jgi:hypothetical protein
MDDEVGEARVGVAAGDIAESLDRVEGTLAVAPMEPLWVVSHVSHAFLGSTG